MTSVDLVSLSLSWVEEVAPRPAPQLLRGAIGSLFPDNPLVHQHDGDQVVYRYPQIQYRWDNSGPLLLGLGEAAHFLVQTEWAGMQLRLGDRTLTVREATCDFRRHTIQGTSRLKRYRFVAPWLPLSQVNYKKYQQLSRAQRRGELDRLAVAGILLGLRGFGVDFREWLYGAFEMQSERPSRYKNIDFLGFDGHLLANIDLPDGFAIGRAVSHGYGWITAVEKGLCDEPAGNTSDAAET